MCDTLSLHDALPIYENILNSSRTTTFMTPKTPVERQLRDGVLALAPEFPFARALVNSGRLSRPCHLHGLPCIAPDDGTVAGAMRPGTPCDDAPVLAAGRPGWLLDFVGDRPTALLFVGDSAGARLPATVADTGIAGLRVVAVTRLPVGTLPVTELHDRDGLVGARYGGAPGVTYLIRPDQHVLGRWRSWDAAALGAAWRSYLGSGKA
jgi:3-(3-hydroxy-phenyl)propionate hydroxylase